MTEIDVRDCPQCEEGTKGNYDGRVLIGGRGIFTCPVCATKWQDANEKPTTKGFALIPPSSDHQATPDEPGRGA